MPSRKLEEPENKRSALMGVGVMKAEPVTAMRAVLKIEEAEVVDSRFRDRQERKRKEVAGRWRGGGAAGVGGPAVQGPPGAQAEAVRLHAEGAERRRGQGRRDVQRMVLVPRH